MPAAGGEGGTGDLGGRESEGEREARHSGEHVGESPEETCELDEEDEDVMKNLLLFSLHLCWVGWTHILHVFVLLEETGSHRESTRTRENYGLVKNSAPAGDFYNLLYLSLNHERASELSDVSCIFLL